MRAWWGRGIWGWPDAYSPKVQTSWKEVRQHFEAVQPKTGKINRDSAEIRRRLEARVNAINRSTGCVFEWLGHSGILT